MRSLDFFGKKEYNYAYKDGTLVLIDIKAFRNTNCPPLFAVGKLFLIEKPMRGDGERIGAVALDPGACDHTGRVEEEDALGYGVALEAHLCRGDGGGVRGHPDGAVRDGGELHDAALAVEDDLLDGVRVRLMARAVEHHVAHGDLPDEGLAARFGGDDPREPMKVGFVVVGGAVLERCGSTREGDGAPFFAPIDGKREDLGERADGNVHRAVGEDLDGHIAVKTPAVGVEKVRAVACGDGEPLAP